MERERPVELYEKASILHNDTKYVSKEKASILSLVKSVKCTLIVISVDILDTALGRMVHITSKLLGVSSRVVLGGTSLKTKIVMYLRTGTDPITSAYFFLFAIFQNFSDVFS